MSPATETGGAGASDETSLGRSAHAAGMARRGPVAARVTRCWSIAMQHVQCGYGYESKKRHQKGDMGDILVTFCLVSINRLMGVPKLDPYTISR